MTNENINKRILLCEPVLETTEPQTEWDWWHNITKLIAEPGTEVYMGGLRKACYGMTTCEESFNSIQMAIRAYEAEQDGYDAFIIGCSSDMGIKECRSLVNIPVVAPTEAVAHLSYTLGKKFSAINLQPSLNDSIELALKNAGLIDRLASIRCSPELTHKKAFAMTFGSEEDQKKLVDLLTIEMEKAVKEDGAEVLFAACAITSSFLTMHNVHKVAGVPVLDLYAVSLKAAESLVDLKRAYGTSVCKNSLYLPPSTNWFKQVSE
jgi:Asp/Glu/hydantoin racemase